MVGLHRLEYALIVTGMVCCCVAVGSDAVVGRLKREVVDEPWFLVVVVGVIVGLLAVVSCVVVAILYQRHISRARKSSKQPVLDGRHLSLPAVAVIIIIIK